MPRVHPAQTEIPVPNDRGRRLSPDEAFAETFGEARLAEEQRRYIEKRACNCHSAKPKRWGRAFHKSGRPRAGKRF